MSSRKTLDELERTGRRPKFIYTVPNHHNPAGVTIFVSDGQRLSAATLTSTQ